MGKRDKKQKKVKKSGGGDDDTSSSGGLLTSMRGGIKNIAGTSGKAAVRTPLQRVGDIVFWVVILAMLALVFYRFGGRGR